MTAAAAGDLVVDAVDSNAVPGTAPASPWADVQGPSWDGTAATAFNPIAYRTFSNTGAIPVATWTQSSADWATVGIALTPAHTYIYTYNAAGELTGVSG